MSLFNLVLEISPVSKVLHYAEFTTLSFVDFSESDNVGMVQHYQNLRFLECFFTLDLVLPSYINFLNDHLGGVTFSLTKDGFAKGT